MPSDTDLEIQDKIINEALREAKTLLSQHREGQPLQEFNVRAKLYDLAHKVAPKARRGEIDTIREWLKPQKGERSIDVAAGSGFLTKYLHDWTAVPPIAVDPSISQLAALRRNAPKTTIVPGYPDDPRTFSIFADASIDFATSLGAIHHVADQRAMFANVARLLRKGGRFVFADVCADTVVAGHFDTVVARKCLTGHTATWLSEGRIAEIVRDLPFRIERIEIVPLFMRFTSETEMYLFFKGLHAYDIPREEVLRDLADVLGVSRVGEEIRLNWPLLFVSLEKTG